jgi:hypothetical protein
MAKSLQERTKKDRKLCFPVIIMDLMLVIIKRISCFLLLPQDERQGKWTKENIPVLGKRFLNCNAIDTKNSVNP